MVLSRPQPDQPDANTPSSPIIKLDDSLSRADLGSGLAVLMQNNNLGFSSYVAGCVTKQNDQVTKLMFHPSQEELLLHAAAALITNGYLPLPEGFLLGLFETVVHIDSVRLEIRLRQTCSLPCKYLEVELTQERGAISGEQQWVGKIYDGRNTRPFGSASAAEALALTLQLLTK